MGSATQKAKPRREAASEPGGKRVSNSCLGSAIKKKTCHSFTHPLNPGNQKKEKRVDAFLAFELKAAFLHLKSIHISSQLHEKEIRFTIRTCPP
jgi:hypothetical protein